MRARAPASEKDTSRPLSPLDRFSRAAGLTRINISSRSGVALAALATLASGDSDRIYRLPISTLVRVAVALGCAPVELLPSLGKRPSKGLLWEAGVFRRKRAEKT